MPIVEDLSRLILALRGVSTYSPTQAPGAGGVELGSEGVKTARESMGGNLEPIPIVKTRWYQKDIERATRLAQNGDMKLIGQLNEAMRVDGVVKGLASARTAFVDYPKRFYGNPDIIKSLQSKNWSDRDVYREMIPSSEARLMAWDGENCGVAIGEMRPVEGRSFPVLVRLYPQNLWYFWPRNTWYYRSVAGLITIRPGVPNADGGWFVLHTPGGRNAPWNNGLWMTSGRSFVGKTESLFARQSYLNKHAHPLRVGEFALGSSENEQRTFVKGLIEWALNSVAALPSGWKTYLVESNGQGIKVYADAIKTFNEELATSICGSSVMLQGTAGFSNMDAFKMVASDLMQTSASGWDHTENTQILTPWVGMTWGVEDVLNATTVETDITPPKDQVVEAQILAAVATAIGLLAERLAPYGLTPNVDELLARFGVPAKTLTPEVRLELDKAAAAQLPAAGGDKPGAAPAPDEKPEESE